jgi:hypothetical protein
MWFEVTDQEMAERAFKPLQSTRVADCSCVDFQIAGSKAIPIIAIGDGE